MSLGAYLAARKGELLLVLLCAWSVTAVCLNGFHLDALAQDYGRTVRALLALPAVAVLLAAIYVGAHQRQRIARAVVLFIVAAALVVVVCMALSSGAQPYADEEGNYLSLGLAAIVVTLLCFLLTRTLAGCLAWFAASSLICSMAQAFFMGEDLLLSFVAAVCALALVVYRNFSLSVRGAQLASKGAGAHAFAASLAPALLCAVAALAVWALVIAPLSPGVLSIKLFTEYKQLPIEEYVGTAQEHPLLNYDMSSRTTVAGEPYTTDDLKEDSTSEERVDAASALQQQVLASQAGQGTGASAGGGSKQDFSAESTDAVYNPVSYDVEFPWAVVWIAAVLALLLTMTAYFLGRRWLRMRRLRRILALPPNAQVKELYRFILGRLERIGFTQPQGSSLREFAASSARQMDTITSVTRVPFTRMTEAYISAVYSGAAPSEEEVVLMTAYYLRFWRAAREHLGNLKYFFASFRL
ncbi:MAG: hypothetical protein ACI36Y_08110 [Coriobacteriales bacterium]